MGVVVVDDNPSAVVLELNKQFNALLTNLGTTAISGSVTAQQVTTVV